MAEATVALAAAIATVIPTAALPNPPAAGALAGQQIVEAAQATGTSQPIAGLVPARLDGKGGVMPVLPAAQAQAQAQAVAQAATPAPAQTAQSMTAPVVTAPVIAAATVTTTVQQDPTATTAAAAAAPAPVAAPAPTGSTTQPAATLTLTISTAPPADPSAAGLEQDAQAPVLTGQAAIPAAAAEKAAPAARPQVQDAAPAAATSPAAPAGSIAPAPVQPLTQADPLGGIVRSGGGLTTPHELARELGTRVHMAVREGGRELVLNLRPADLGHLTIRVTMNDGIMQAQIIADRPEAARMLQQSMEHLDSALGDLGYSLDNLDVAYQGQDPRDAQTASQRKADDGAVTGEVLEADGSPADSGTSTSAAAGSPARLDILA